MKEKGKQLSSFAIGDKIRKGVNFWVGTNKERMDALRAAKYAGAEIVTKKAQSGGFHIHFLRLVAR